MKQILLALALVAAGAGSAFAQVVSIASARAAAIGTTITVRGIVSNGAELGSIRYMQDGTAGIGAYFSTSQLGALPVNRGDSIEVTGVTKLYNNLLEIDPITAYSVVSSNNPVHPAQMPSVSAGFAEAFEGQLVRFNNVTFAMGGGTFSGNTNYNITAGGGSTTYAVRVVTTSPLVGTPIPTGAVNIQGIISQFKSGAVNTTSGYQLLLRDLNDVNVGNLAPIFATSLMQSNITTTSFDVAFNTVNAGNAIVYYGTTSAMGQQMSNAAMSTTHSVSLSGLTPATIYYVKAISISGTDTSFSGVARMGTKSLSSGKITTYFNSTIDTSVKTTVAARRLPGTIDDTIIAYMNRAQSTLDIAIYNWNDANLSAMAAAANAAAARGVRVRVVYDGNTANAAVNTLSPAIKKVAGPQSSLTYGIMHNKFMIIDAEATNPNKPIVWTGSTNWTDQQINLDCNNVVIFQDQTMARGYTIEFEEMWGSTGANPGTGLFGAAKMDNTPHVYNIGGKKVESYFSPSDNTEGNIINAINTADKDIEIALFEMTRTAYSSAIRSKYFGNNNIFIGGVEDDTSSAVSQAAANTPFRNLATAQPTHFFLYQRATPSLPGLLHHKYAIIDQSDANSDPMVVTGSHNWSAAANTKNDENTVIIPRCHRG